MLHILPIKPPPITSYQQIALPLAVAMMNPTAENWFYSNYIQVSCVNRKYYISKGNHDNALHYGFYNPEIISPESVEHIRIEGRGQLYVFRKTNFIKETMEDGWYIYTDADMFYIDGSDGFGKVHYPHDMLIYGYEDDRAYIYMYNESKLTTHIVSYVNLLKAYYSEYCDEEFYRNRAILFKPNDKICEVNFEKIRWHMHDYLNGTETFAREKPHIFNPDSLTMNGVETYKEFEDLIDYAIINRYKDLRQTDLYCFFEHKKVMLDRVIYLRNNGYLSASDELLHSFEIVKKSAEILMFLGLKTNTLEDPEKKNITLLRMKDNIKTIQEHEISAWNRYIDENKEILG